MPFDFDYLVVGSGFGGSVSALRLAEKGYRVGVIEMGKRWRPQDFPRTNWNLRRFVWMPLFKLHGIFNMTLLRHVFILRGIGVGGGSLVYANTLLVAPDAAWTHPAWAHLEDWKRALAPHYETAKRMLGATENPVITEPDRIVAEYAAHLGRGDSFRPTTVGVWFGEAGKTIEDPYFDGQGPPRTGCVRCGGCMVGCRYGAKNTLDHNYLWLAERRGVRVLPERRVIRLEPLSGGGWRVHFVRSTRLIFKERGALTARGVVLSAGVMGTVPLLLRHKERGWLPHLSERLGALVRTNSEAIVAATSRRALVDFSEGIAIGSSVALDDHTNLEPVRYNKGSDLLSLLGTLLTDGGGRIPRVVRWLGVCLSHPLLFLLSLWPFGWAKRTIILLVMQTVDNHLRLVLRRRWWWPFCKVADSEQPPGQARVPTFIPAANDAARWIARRVNGVPTSSITEVALDVPSTAHILGGCPMGASPSEGVIDSRNRVFGYDELYVCDGSMIGANLGVNPSLTITAMTERAMSFIPERKARPAGWADGEPDPATQPSPAG